MCKATKRRAPRAVWLAAYRYVDAGAGLAGLDKSWCAEALVLRDQSAANLKDVWADSLLERLAGLDKVARYEMLDLKIFF
ncbi:MAG: hypothetical protein AAFR90_10660 [Pseudomonadota bacterium]